MKFKNHYNCGNSEGLGTRGTTQTVQDMSLTVGQYLQRIQGGIPFTPAGLQYPENEEDMSFRINDLTDIDNMMDVLDRGLKKIREANEAAAKAKNEQKGEPKEAKQKTADLESDEGASE